MPFDTPENINIVNSDEGIKRTANVEPVNTCPTTGGALSTNVTNPVRLADADDCSVRNKIYTNVPTTSGEIASGDNPLLVTGTFAAIDFENGVVVPLTTGQLGALRVEVTNSMNCLEIQEDDNQVATNIGVINFEGDVDVIDEGSRKVTVTVNSSGTQLITQEYDANVETNTTILNFEGDVSLTNEGSGKVTVDVDANSTVQKDDVNVATNINTFNFEGPFSVVNEGGGKATITNLASGSELEIQKDDTTINPSAVILNFEGAVTTTDEGSGKVTVNILDTNDDEQVKVSANDNSSGYLNGKLIQGSNITLTEQNDGGNEILLISSTNTDEFVKVSTNDASAGFLGAKLVQGANITITENNDGNNETLIIASTDTNDDEKVKVSSNDTTPSFLLSKLSAGTNILLIENNDGGNETITISTTAIGGEAPILQIRRTTSLAIPTSWVDISFDTVDEENDTDVIEFDDVNTDRILIKEDGVYFISYKIDIDADTVGSYDFRVRKNDATTLNGSVINGAAASTLEGLDNFSTSFIYRGNAGDFLTVQTQGSVTGNEITGDSSFKIIKLTGTKGEKGDPGTGSTIDIQEDDTAFASGVGTLNFEGDINLTDEGSGKVTVSVVAPQVVFGSEFQEDSDDDISSTTSTSFQQKLRLTTGNLPTGKYRIGWSYEYRHTSTTADFRGRIQIDDIITISEIREESKDSGSDQWKPAGGFYFYTGSGVTNIDLDFCRGGGSGTSSIRNARLEIWRVS